MKNVLKKTTALVLSAAMFCSSLAASADSILHSDSMQIAPGLDITASNSLNLGTYKQDFTLDYTPNEKLKPIVLYGDKLYGRSTISEITAYAQSLGYTVMGAVNSDYFYFENGLPIGMTIQNGRLCTSDANWNAVGFFADGTAIVGEPKLEMTFSPSPDEQHTVYALNKVRTGNGVYLYTPDFSSTTKTVLDGVEVVLTAEQGQQLKLGTALELTVASVGAVSGTTLAPDTFVLSVTADNPMAQVLLGMTVGQTIMINATTEDPRWNEVVWATGGGNMLAREGVLTVDATNGLGPRTILGVAPDGSFSIYVCDGRQSGLSNGASLYEVANSMISRGYTSVIELDGGGSTAISARYPGQTESTLRSSPSDGSERGCATYILFVNTGDPTLPESAASVYPRSSLVLAGAQLSLSALTYNEDFFPKGSYDDLFVVKEGGGYIIGNTYYAPIFAEQAIVSADIGGFDSSDAVITVIDKPATLDFVQNGTDTPLTSLSIAPEDSIDLDITATDGLRDIHTDGVIFSYQISGGIGTIDANGLFTAAAVSGLTGSITVTYGETTATLPVTVGDAPEILEDFEQMPTYTAVPATEQTVATALVSQAVEHARYGIGSLYLAWEQGDELIPTRFSAAQPISLPQGATTVSLLARNAVAGGGDGTAYLDVQTPLGSVQMPIPLSDSWQYIALTLPEGATAINGFSSTGTSGALYLDQLMAHFGQAANDVLPPTITLNPFDGLVLSGIISDNYLFPVEPGMIEISIDGTAVPFTYDQNTGEFSCEITPTAGLHRATITVRDFFLNYARHSVTFGETETVSAPDIADHWSYDYAEYLIGKDVFTAGTPFDPNGRVTNEMAAVIIARYMGVDPTQYEDVILPHADADQIGDWALPYVKAMYAEGVMMGTYSSGTAMYYPQTQSSRAQIFTIIGRTLDRGFAYGDAPFTDFDTIPAWAVDHINLLYSMGIISGYGTTGAVYPNEIITRAEFASLLFKMY